MRCALAAAFALGVVIPSMAQRAKTKADTLDNLAFAKPETRLTAINERILPGAGFRASVADSRTMSALAAFLDAEGAGWHAVFDRVSGRPSLLEGRGIPWIPGTANSLTRTGPGLAPGGPLNNVPVSVVADKALDFIRNNPDMLGVQPGDLRLISSASGPLAGYLYFVDFQWTYHGIPVEKAHVVFRLNHGNLVQVGEEHIDDSIRALDPRPTIDRETAWQILWGYVGRFGPGDEILEPGRLIVIPVSTPEALAGESIQPGTGLHYRLVYLLEFRRKGVMGTWEARVDAHTGEIVAFVDANKYGSVHGGVYPGDHPMAEVDRPLPFVDLGNGQYADGGGLFEGQSATSALSGKYVKISDMCGDISNTTATGDLDFGSGEGTDCDTPGFGGPGNTHAARTQYYQVNLIKMKALTYLPDNKWLAGQLTDNVNIDQTCNAYWDGSALNFFKSGGGCSNTGELPGVSLHEWGHGLDSNDGNGSSPDNGTGETYGDFTAVLQTHSSCVGNGFQSSNCSGYGDACNDCSGVRDIDWGKHHDQQPATTTMMSDYNGFHCSTDPTYPGPCGYEGHCESAISSQALWDLATRDLPDAGMDQATAWQLVDRLWYLSRPSATAAYTCTGKDVSSGCGSGSLFSVFRVVDDADGNLANGTPHAAAIYAAFNRHGIACDDVNNGDQAGYCPELVKPVISVVPGNSTAQVTWGAVQDAQSYEVFRNETGCDAGYTRVGRVDSPATGFTDASVINGLAYYYRVQAIASTGDGACRSAMSDCFEATPQSCAGSVVLDRLTYNCDDTIRIFVMDSDLTGAGSQDVTIWSDLETTPETVTLTETPADSGRFMGTIRTSTSTESGDGAVGVANGTVITARYEDASACGTPGVSAEATAVADCLAPTITNVQVTPFGLAAVIRWTTSEPTTGHVSYGPASPETPSAEDKLGTSHSVKISGLSTCTDYVFTVASTDTSGNETLDTNGGDLYGFTTLDLAKMGQASTDVPKTIPDNDSHGVYSTLNVDSAYTVSHVTVTVNIKHPYDGDLAITLMHPDGSWVRLAMTEGGPGHDYQNTTFDDDASTPISEGQPPFSGTFAPVSPLEAFSGKPASGQWRLYVHDLGRGDVGTLLNWSLTLTEDVPCSDALRALPGADQVSGLAPMTVHFTGSALHGTPPYTYTWAFGDGQTQSGENVTHTYTAGGSYTVGLTVTDGAGHSASNTMAVNAASTIDPPAITSVSKAGAPFRLKIYGTNFHEGCVVKINGEAVPQVKFKNEGNLVAKKGAALKAMVPKGTQVMITVVNTDDGGVSGAFPFSW